MAGYLLSEETPGLIRQVALRILKPQFWPPQYHHDTIFELRPGYVLVMRQIFIELPRLTSSLTVVHESIRE